MHIISSPNVSEVVLAKHSYKPKNTTMELGFIKGQPLGIHYIILDSGWAVAERVILTDKSLQDIDSSPVFQCFETPRLVPVDYLTPISRTAPRFKRPPLFKSSNLKQRGSLRRESTINKRNEEARVQREERIRKKLQTAEMYRKKLKDANDQLSIKNLELEDQKIQLCLSQEETVRLSKKYETLKTNILERANHLRLAPANPEIQKFLAWLGLKTDSKSPLNIEKLLKDYKVLRQEYQILKKKYIELNTD